MYECSKKAFTSVSISSRWTAPSLSQVVRLLVRDSERQSVRVSSLGFGIRRVPGVHRLGILGSTPIPPHPRPSSFIWSYPWLPTLCVRFSRLLLLLLLLPDAYASFLVNLCFLVLVLIDKRRQCLCYTVPSWPPNDAEFHFRRYVHHAGADAVAQYVLALSEVLIACTPLLLCTHVCTFATPPHTRARIYQGIGVERGSSPRLKRRDKPKRFEEFHGLIEGKPWRRTHQEGADPQMCTLRDCLTQELLPLITSRYGVRVWQCLKIRSDVSERVLRRPFDDVDFS